MRSHPHYSSSPAHPRSAFLITLLILFGGAAPTVVGQEGRSKFRSLFDGQTLSGWHGNNPHSTARAEPEGRAAAVETQQAEFVEHWRAENGELVNDGRGPYATTDEDFGDIELQLDYKTVAKADSGIYLRGTPQIQIWDTTREGGKWDRDADAGSGGLFNNTKGAPGQLPLRLADKPFGRWNHFRVVQIGSRTWVELNDQLVVDGAIMENYWDKQRATPLSAAGPIHLQTHGGEIRWKNVRVREIGTDEAISRLRGDDSKFGFVSLFNGEDLSGWSGAVDDYEVKNRAIVCKSGKGGVLFTDEEYENFVVRLEFKLPPGGNNGLAIRYPGQGRAAYDGMCELQVLDDSAEKYSKLDPRQYHGSVYGIAAAHRGYLNPAGEWNYQEVTVDGSWIKVELNGTVIVDTDVSEITEYKGDLAHPGKDRPRGHFGFAGHNDPVMFRNIAIKRLPDSPQRQAWEDVRSGLVFHASFDDGTDADLSTGHGKLRIAESTKREKLLDGDGQTYDYGEVIEIDKGRGRSGGALRFKKKVDEVFFYEGIEAGYQKENWSGTVSVWLKLDPDRDLEPGFCDPIQITERAWNDGAFFIDFDKELPRDFRFGVFPDFETWNPNDTKFNDVPVADRPLVTVESPPFRRDAWTHVCFTWRNVNATDGSPASSSLYLNGQLQGAIRRPLRFTWNPKDVGVMIGVNYVGLMDELSIHDRALTEDQVQHLYRSPADLR